VPEGFGSLEEFIAIITAPPTWASDFPIAAKGRITDRLIEIKEPKLAGDNVLQPPPDDDGEATPVDEIVEPLPWEESKQRAAAGAVNTNPPPPPPPPPPEEPSPPPPPEEPPTGNGRGSFEGFDDIDDLPPPRDSYRCGEAPKGSPSAAYIYKDAQGRLYMRVTRTDAKSFPTHHWDSNSGSWKSGWPKTVIPYRLPELLAAPASEPVWICEGEKDTDNVTALGLVATTNP